VDFKAGRILLKTNALSLCAACATFVHFGPFWRTGGERRWGRKW